METGTALSTALPSGWIERLFERLAGLYGKHWLDLWANIPTEQVMATWEDALHGVKGEQIRKALDHLTANNPFPPTCPEFVSLCRQFRPPPEPAPPRLVALPMPKYETGVELFERKGDGRDWAREIIALADAGRYTLPYGIACAREALYL